MLKTCQLLENGRKRTWCLRAGSKSKDKNAQQTNQPPCLPCHNVRPKLLFWKHLAFVYGCKPLVMFHVICLISMCWHSHILSRSWLLDCTHFGTEFHDSTACFRIKAGSFNAKYVTDEALVQKQLRIQPYRLSSSLMTSSTTQQTANGNTPWHSVSSFVCSLVHSWRSSYARVNLLQSMTGPCDISRYVNRIRIPYKVYVADHCLLLSENGTF